MLAAAPVRESAIKKGIGGVDGVTVCRVRCFKLGAVSGTWLVHLGVFLLAVGAA